MLSFLCREAVCEFLFVIEDTHTQIYRSGGMVEAEGLILFHISLHTLSSFASCEGSRASLQLRDECTLIVLHNYTNQFTSSFMQDHNKWGKKSMEGKNRSVLRSRSDEPCSI